MNDKMHYFENRIFEHLNEKQTLQQGEYDSCRFVHCDFSGHDFTDFVFTDCLFVDCNLSSTRLTRCGLFNTSFTECKMLGLRFEDCLKMPDFSQFKNCKLDHSTFCGLKMKKTRFEKCSLRDVDFSDADLSESGFKESDLQNALFSGTNLSSSDFTEAHNFLIDPEGNILKKARFSRNNIDGLLSKYRIILSE